MDDICYTSVVLNRNWLIVSTTNINTALDSIKSCKNEIRQEDHIVVYKFCNGEHLTSICFNRDGYINTDHTDSILFPIASFTKDEVNLVKKFASEFNTN